VNPKDILVIPIEPNVGLTDKICNQVVEQLELTSIADKAKEQLKNLY
jgi:hypothetical protein